jgi:hypothetical protein
LQSHFKPSAARFSNNDNAFTDGLYRMNSDI